MSHACGNSSVMPQCSNQRTRERALKGMMYEAIGVKTKLSTIYIYIYIYNCIYIYLSVYIYRRVDICRTAYRVLNSKLEHSTFETNQQYI